MLCICGSKIEETNCCLSIIKGKKVAALPVQLMRSRFYGYAKHHIDYLYNTYASAGRTSSLKEEIEQWCKETRWVKLIIRGSQDIDLNSMLQGADYTSHNEQLPTVEFTAFYFQNKYFCEMNENSRFIIEDQQWRYLDGIMGDHINHGIIARNELCPCGSKKKFKRCCNS